MTDSINSAARTKNLLKLQNGRIEDLQKEKIFKLSTNSNLRSAIIMPLISEDMVGGVLFLARRSPREYSEEDLSIVQIACNQVAVRIKQAQYHIDERKAADSIGVLYRLSHELSKYLTPREVSEHAVRIISEEMPCRRIWLGVMNEQRTHVAGHAGFGPGIRQQIIQLQLELDLRHEFFDEAIESRKPVIVQPGQKMDCSGLEKIIRKLSPQAFVIVPLVSLGQVVGVLVLEPQNPSIFFGEGRLPLLMNIANEIATVLLGRRFEAKVADTEKMKMAGLLASGVSHNFNNLLQTIMGHASLIQMQSTPSSRIEDSARRIIEASGKGAALVNQLMTVSSRNIFSRKNISVNKLFQESRDFYKSVLGPEVSLEIDLEDGIPSVLADYSQIQQVITNLLLNSKDAIEGRRDGFVKLQTRRVRVASGEVSTDLAPGSYIRIDVQDNGRGMNEEVQSRCFEPFFTTKGRDPQSGVGLGGSGLGLSSAYSILRQHAGYIGVKSQEGSGTIFSIYLPLLHPAVEKEEILREESVSRKRADVHVFSSDMVVISAVKLSLDAFGLLNYVSSNSDDLKSEITGKEDFHGILIVDLDDSDIQINKIASKRGKVAKDLRCIFVGRDLERWQKFVQKFKHAEFVKKPLGAWSLHTSLSRLLSLREIGPLSKEIEVSKEAAPPKKKRRRTAKRNATGNGERDEEML
ncbi:MAG: GAF domain-containing protein [SAR324 cluster bacterium]|uniref:histidine kinase n=1 Tax=SAR324 cluster bacterium TaxID=2024889 RepID=A0A7X9FSB0_9DELT|nr:GAF domain-containing protein [SAR324 cluster bacterium]